jgi:hypothetical protein
MTPALLANYTDVELLRELIKRSNLGPAAKVSRRASPHSSAIIGIGADHIAEIVIAEDALVELNALVGD